MFLSLKPTVHSKIVHAAKWSIIKIIRLSFSEMKTFDSVDIFENSVLKRELKERVEEMAKTFVR
eukprot:UN22533